MTEEVTIIENDELILSQIRRIIVFLGQPGINDYETFYWPRNDEQELKIMFNLTKHSYNHFAFQSWNEVRKFWEGARNFPQYSDFFDAMRVQKATQLILKKESRKKAMRKRINFRVLLHIRVYERNLGKLIPSEVRRIICSYF